MCAISHKWFISIYSNVYIKWENSCKHEKCWKLSFDSTYLQHTFACDSHVFMMNIESIFLQRTAHIILPPFEFSLYIQCSISMYWLKRALKWNLVRYFALYVINVSIVTIIVYTQREQSTPYPFNEYEWYRARGNTVFVCVCITHSTSF